MAREMPEPGSPQTVLLAAVRQRLARVPFEPFRIVTTSGRAYEVPTADHAGIVPLLRMIIIAQDDCSETQVHALHVSAIEPLNGNSQIA